MEALGYLSLFANFIPRTYNLKELGGISIFKSKCSLKNVS